MDFIFVIINLIFFVAVSILCLFFTDKLQEYTIKHSKGDFFIDYIKSPTYCFVLKIIGVVTLTIVLLIIYRLFIK